MRHLSRVVSLCLSLVLLQLVLVEGGYACGIGGGPDAQMAAMAVPMPDMSTGMATPHQPEHNEAPCRFPWAPDGCQTMAPCAPAALVEASTSFVSATVPRTSAPILTVLALVSPAQPPELPPPRA